MIRYILIITLLLNLSYAGTERYFIQFGSFKDLRNLEHSIAKLPSSLRSHVVIVLSNSWYIPFAYYTTNQQALVSKLPLYKRYFRDAHIARSSYMLKHPVVRNYATKKRAVSVPRREYLPLAKTYPNIATSGYAPTPRRVVPQYQNVGIRETAVPLKKNIVTQKVVINEVKDDKTFKKSRLKKYKNFSKQMLSGNYYYLAYQKTDNNPNLLIKVSFGNHQVTYQPIVGEMKMTTANYLTEGNKLYMFTDGFTRNGSFSVLDEHEDDHFLVSSWVKGKKLNTLRYYYKMNDAKEYLGIGTSDGLAEILSEGEYDDFFLDE